MNHRWPLCLLALASFQCAAPPAPDGGALDGGDGAIADRTAIDTPVPDATVDDAAIDAEPSDTSDNDSASADVEAPDAERDDAAMDSGVSFDAVAMDVRSDSRVDARSDAAADVRSDAGADGSPPDPPGTWRSTLFPRGWLPLHAGGAAASDGKFLHDFSFAGYRRGEAPPVGMGTVRATLMASAFGDGRDDAAPAIQTAINNACAMGGGVIPYAPKTPRLEQRACAVNRETERRLTQC